MLDLAWSELLVIAIVLIVVVGPKDLPRLLRTFGRTMTKFRSMAGDFRKQFDEAVKEAELDDLKSLADDARKLNPTAQIKKALNPMEQAAKDVRAGLDKAMKPAAKPMAPPTPAETLKVAEPLKPGPDTLPAAMTATPAAKKSATNGAAPVKAARPAPKPKAAAPKPAAAPAKAVAKPKAQPKAPKAKDPK